MPSYSLGLRDSSNVKGAEYDPDTQQLVVAFKEGGTYTYSGISQDLADEFARADSPGGFLHSRIKGQFQHDKNG